jgi:hypothetical protein
MSLTVSFVQRKIEPVSKCYPPPVIPKDVVVLIHRSIHSRFDLKPITQAELRGLGRHDLNAHQRAAILNHVLSMPPETQQAEPAKVEPPVLLTPAEVVAQSLIQIKKNIEAQQEKCGQVVQETEQKAKSTVDDPEKEAKTTK